MSAPVFLAPREDLLAAAVPGGHVRLGGAEGRHAATVRRLERGERVELVDGSGLRLAGDVVSADREAVVVAAVARTQERAPAPRFVLAQALAKGDRGELAVETATEAGVDAVLPWTAARSVVQWKGDRGDRALERWRSTAREAAKQARRAWFPVVGELLDRRGLVAAAGAAALAVVLHEEATTPLAGLALPDDGDVLLVVGPEGGLTGDERDALAAAGAVEARLGPTVLRTSTAGVAALAVLSAAGRWR